MLKRLKQAWKRDRLGVLGIASAVVAFLFWAWPVLGSCKPLMNNTAIDWGYIDGTALIPGSCYALFNEEFGWATDNYFTLDRLPFAAAFLALAFVLLLLRRR